MKRSRFSEEEITHILAEYRAGTRPSELARKHNVTTTTLRSWHRKYGSMQGAELLKLRSLEEENNKLKRIVSQQAVELLAAKDIIGRFR